MAENTKFLTPEQAARVDRSRFDAEKIDRPTITYWQGAWRRLKKNPLAVTAMVMMVVILFFILPVHIFLNQFLTFPSTLHHILFRRFFPIYYRRIYARKHHSHSKNCN